MEARLRHVVSYSVVLMWAVAWIADPNAAAKDDLKGITASSNRYVGQFCEGQGDVEFLRLIDESFAFFHPNPVVPNLAMLYQPEWDTFEEGAGWGAWWIQNSYGFSYTATPFLQEPWFSTLQRSWDLFWDRQGDGKRVGRPDFPLVAPDGCLGDCASPAGIVYKQGDGNWKIHDWFHEATAAGVVMQAEILLASRDRNAMARYLPKMQRACDSIERTRDPKNHLFLVGPACNLLGPATAVCGSPMARSARATWRAFRSPISPRWTEWSNCTSSPAIKRILPSTSGGRKSPASRSRNCGRPKAISSSPSNRAASSMACWASDSSATWKV